MLYNSFYLISRLSYISGARSVDDKRVRIASTKLDGMGSKIASKFNSRRNPKGVFRSINKKRHKEIQPSDND